MPNDDEQSFADWWGDITFEDEYGEIYESSEYEFEDRMWAIEYAYEHGWDMDELLDHLYDDSADFWEYWRTEYGGT